MGIRALADITSGPEVQNFFKIRTVWTPEVFLPRHWTFNTFENRKKKIKFCEHNRLSRESLHMHSRMYSNSARLNQSSYFMAV